MGQFSSNSERVYGGMPSDGSAQAYAFDAHNQGISEVLVPGTYRRMVNGPSGTGHYSLNVFVDAAGGATSAMTVWYSNLPNPSLASDADWTQDTTIASIDLTALGPVIKFAKDTVVEWIMVKAVVAASNASIRAIVCREQRNQRG